MMTIYLDSVRTPSGGRPRYSAMGMEKWRWRCRGRGWLAALSPLERDVVLYEQMIQGVA